jgi:hypothetical protein
VLQQGDGGQLGSNTTGLHKDSAGKGRCQTSVGCVFALVSQQGDGGQLAGGTAELHKDSAGELHTLSCMQSL